MCFTNGEIGGNCDNYCIPIKQWQKSIKGKVVETFYTWEKVKYVL